MPSLNAMILQNIQNFPSYRYLFVAVYVAIHVAIFSLYQNASNSTIRIFSSFVQFIETFDEVDDFVKSGEAEMPIKGCDPIGCLILFDSKFPHLFQSETVGPAVIYLPLFTCIESFLCSLGKICSLDICDSSEVRVVHDE